MTYYFRMTENIRGAKCVRSRAPFQKVAMKRNRNRRIGVEFFWAINEKCAIHTKVDNTKQHLTVTHKPHCRRAYTREIPRSALANGFRSLKKRRGKGVDILPMKSKQKTREERTYWQCITTLYDCRRVWIWIARSCRRHMAQLILFIYFFFLSYVCVPSYTCADGRAGRTCSHGKDGKKTLFSIHKICNADRLNDPTDI